MVDDTPAADRRVPNRETVKARAEKALKPHRFRYQDRAEAKRLGISAVESSGVPYWDAVEAVVEVASGLLGIADDLIRAETLEAAARALRAEFEPLTTRTADWRNVERVYLEAAAERRKAAGA